MPRKVLDRRALPTQLPLNSTLIAGLVLDRTHAPGWVYGILGTILGIIWIGAITNWVQEEPTSLRELQ